MIVIRARSFPSVKRSKATIYLPMVVLRPHWTKFATNGTLLAAGGVVSDRSIGESF